MTEYLVPAMMAALVCGAVMGFVFGRLSRLERATEDELLNEVKRRRIKAQIGAIVSKQVDAEVASAARAKQP
jgi:hypothetical protein